MAQVVRTGGLAADPHTLSLGTGWLWRPQGPFIGYHLWQTVVISTCNRSDAEVQLCRCSLQNAKAFQLPKFHLLCQLAISDKSLALTIRLQLLHRPQRLQLWLLNNTTPAAMLATALTSAHKFWQKASDLVHQVWLVLDCSVLVLKRLTSSSGQTDEGTLVLCCHVHGDALNWCMAYDYRICTRYVPC